MQQKPFATPPPPPTPGTPPDCAEPWYSISPRHDIWELLLNHDPSDNLEKSVLQYYSPGASTMTQTSITHPYIEEIIFLEGGLEDMTSRKMFGKGAYAYRKPGMRHGPYKAGREGCLQFVRIVPVEAAKEAEWVGKMEGLLHPGGDEDL